MINVSSEFREIMKTRQDFREKAEVLFADGTILYLDEDDFSISNNSVTDAAGANAVPLGTAICRNVQIELLNDDDHLKEYDFYGAGIRLYLIFELSETTEKIEYGTFTVTSPESYGTVVTVNAYDDMYKANAVYDTGLTFPASAGAVLRDACSRCDIVLETASFIHEDFLIQSKPSSEYTFRQVIGWIAMLACGNARINRKGRLEILSYDLDFTKEHHELTEWHSLTVDTGDITVTGIRTTRKVKKITGDRETEAEETVTAGSEGYMLTISNPLAEGSEETLVSWLAERLTGVPFRKFSGGAVTYPLAEFMDLAEIQDWKGNRYHTFLTDIDFVFFGITELKNSAESGLRNAAKYNNSNAGTNVYLQGLVEKERTDRENAVEKLNEALQTGSGLYATYEKQPDGSTVTYLHDKPVLEESRTVIKITAEAVGVSNDGGKTYPYGLVLNGDIITKILYTHGISADYIDTGALTVKDDEGNIIFSVDIDTGAVYINGSTIRIGGRPLSEVTDEALKNSQEALNAAAAARNMTMLLSDDYVSIPVDSSGNYYGAFPAGITTSPKVMYGAEDISGLCVYTVSESGSITGSWDLETRTYTVTDLRADTGWVDIRASYLDTLSVTKRFDVVKLRSGSDGADAIVLQILSSAGNIFKNSAVSTTLTVTIIVADEMITSSKQMYEKFGSGASLKWEQKRFGQSGFEVIAPEDPRLSDEGFILTINSQDVFTQTVFNCTLDY